MTKRDKNFKLSKQTKRLLMLATEPSKRKFYRDLMIDAEIIASIPVKIQKVKDDESKGV